MRHKGKQHFSHEHILIPIKLDDGEELKCKACEGAIDDEPFYGCPPCQFFLHKFTCFDAPRSMLHPSHPSHPLALNPMPTYPTRSFTCNACGSQGKAFSLSCAHCEYDLHLFCAELSETFFFEPEHPHELKLIFGPPCKDGAIIPCYICSDPNQNLWLYYCEPCTYVAHLKCLYAKDEESNDVSVQGESSSGVGEHEPVDEGSSES